MKFKILFVIALTYASTLTAVPLIDEPLATLTLTNGRILHDVEAKSYASKSVMVRHRDGAETIAYNLFPADLQPALLAKRPTPPTPEQIEARKLAIEQAKTKKSVEEKAASQSIAASEKARTHNGLYLTQNSSSTIPHIVMVEITNQTNNPKNLWASNLIGTLSSGETTSGDKVMCQNGDFTYVEIPGNSTVKIGIIFNLAHVRKESITDVRWE